MISDFRCCWKALALTDVLFKCVAFVILTPLLGVLLRLFVSWSGRTVLADVDILYFFLHPIGWACFIIVAGFGLGIFALEQAALMAIVCTADDGRPLAPRQSLRFTFQNAHSVIYLATRAIGLLLVIAVPFLALGAGLYVALLTEHDINYYLARKPPVFWVAVSAIGITLVALTVVMVRCVIAWCLALPLVLFENVPVREALGCSSARTAGQRLRFCLYGAGWFAGTSLISTLGAGLVAWLGRLLVPVAAGSLWQPALAVGGILLLWAAVQFAITLFATSTFAILLGNLYMAGARSENLQLPKYQEVRSSLVFSMSMRRVTAISVCALLVSATIGFTAMHSIHLEDQTQIIAHRGASGTAPENSLAAVRQAIEDEADWVEIDVQETKDGVVVVAHDSDLMKVSGANVRIWEATAEELRSIDIGSFFDPKFDQERVPTLEEVLQLCKGKVKVNIELKYYGHDQSLEQRVIDLVEAASMESDVVVMSLKAEGIEKVKKLRPNWTVGLLTAVAAGDLTQAKADFLAVNVGLAKESFIRSAHRKGKRVLVWTVNDKVTMSLMIGRGVDGIITDHPALAREVLAERAAMSPVERLLLEAAPFLDAGVKSDPAS